MCIGKEVEESNKMKCSNCGEPVEEGRLFCLNCGQEVQWVPDYDSFGNYMEQERIRKEQERIRKEHAEAEAARRRAAIAAENRRKKKKRKMITAVVGCLCLAVGIGVAVGVKMTTEKKNYNDFGYQMRMADTAFSNRKYEECYEFVERAVTLDADDADAQLLKAQVLVKLEREKEAMKVLEALIENDPDNTTAYGQLIKIYDASEMKAEIKELLDKCDNDQIKEKYSGYISTPPVFSLPGGEYSEQKTLQLYAKGEGGTIYYTTDGTEPTEDSTLYTGSIDIKDGTTTVKAIVINSKGISSDVVTNQYTVTFVPPDPPKISPSSGKFTTDMDTKIYIIVPEGCKAYYAFDRKPTIADEEYDEDEPVKMQKGTHTFYAILVDEHGKVSYPGSATYSLTDPD